MFEPYSYLAKSNLLAIKHLNNTHNAGNSALFFRIPEIHGCVNMANVFQPPGQDYMGVELIRTMKDSRCRITILTYKHRPRRLVINQLSTDSTDLIKVTGGVYKNEVEYFHFK